MNRDDIIRMAREADAYEHYVSEADDMPWSVEFSLTNLEAFAALVAAAALAEPVQGPRALKWFPAPRKTEWGFGMVSADIEIDRDHTLTLYCEKDQTAKVDAMFRRGTDVIRKRGET